MQKSKVELALEEARDDIENASWPGLLGTILAPMRDKVWTPALGLAQEVVPVVTKKIPFADSLAGSSIRFSSHVIKAAYGILPHSPTLRKEAADTLFIDSLDTINDARLEGGILRNFPKDLLSLILTLTGFTLNALLDFLRAPGLRLREWIKTIEVFVAYLLRVGIVDELQTALVTPRLVENMLIMATVQKDLGFSSKSRREEAAFPHDPTTAEELSAILADSRRYMRYSTAAYGVLQALVSVVETQFISSERALIKISGAVVKLQGLVRRIAQKERRRRIAKYLDIEEKDILFMTLSGGDPDVVGHFVAVDHRTESVVLAIRGTYSVSDIVTDLDANTIEFCGGVAHQGMALRALTLWENAETQRAIRIGLDANRTYRLVLTGHSLGGGIANLLHIKYNFEQNTMPANVRCFGYGSPPSYAAFPTQPIGVLKRVHGALLTSITFIGGNDTIPFLSVDSIRRFLDTLIKVDAITAEMPVLDRWLVGKGTKNPPTELTDVIRDGSEKLDPVAGAERLKIAASKVIWFEQKDDCRTDFLFCKPTKLARLPIFLTTDMVADHLPQMYEEGINSL